MTALRNVTTGQTICDDLEFAKSHFARFRGLMLRGQLPPRSGLVIQPCGSIHMMFMRFPIDAIFFDRDLRVTKVARNVPTWRGLAFGGRGAHAVIEAPVGTGEGIEQGHQLEFVDGLADG